MSESTKKKMSETQKKFRFIHKDEDVKRVRIEEVEEYLSNGWLLGLRDSDYKKSAESRKGKPMSEETKQKLSKAIKGRKMSEEARANIAANNKARANDPVIRKKISDAKKGKKHSPEHKEKVAAAKRGVPQSEESKRKRSEAMKGKHWYFDKQLNKRVYVS